MKFFRGKPPDRPVRSGVPGSRPIAAGSGVLGGMAMMVLSTACLAAMYVGIRSVPGGMHPFQIVFLRNLFGLCFLLAWHARSLASLYRTAQLKTHGLRSVLNVAAMMMFFSAVVVTPLVDVSALAFTAPLFASLLAVPLLGERFHWYRAAALAVGFAGTLLVLRPGLNAISGGHLLLLGSASVWGVALMVIKKLTRNDSSATVTVYSGTFMTPITLVAASFYWQWPSLEQLLWTALIAALGTVGQISLAQSFRMADASAVLPLDFFKLVWGAALGFLLFAEIPDIWTLVGGAVIFASATSLALRETRLSRPAAPNKSRPLGKP